MLPFPCQTEVILAPFLLSSPHWDAPVSLMQAEMLPNTALGGEGLLLGAPQPQLRFIHGDRLSKGDRTEPGSHPSEHVASGQSQA